MYEKQRLELYSHLTNTYYNNRHEIKVRYEIRGMDEIQVSGIHLEFIATLFDAGKWSIIKSLKAMYYCFPKTILSKFEQILLAH